jgi:hypothetical protein
MKKFTLSVLLALLTHTIYAQNAPNDKVQIFLYDGIIVGGYVNDGGFLNCTGPNINMTKGNSRIILGMLPSLRFKQDHATPRNAFVTPALGMGLTFCYKALVLQLPAYYNARTASTNGRWHLGIGIGLRTTQFNKKK